MRRYIAGREFVGRNALRPDAERWRETLHFRSCRVVFGVVSRETIQPTYKRSVK